MRWCYSTHIGVSHGNALGITTSLFWVFWRNRLSCAVTGGKSIADRGEVLIAAVFIVDQRKQSRCICWGIRNEC